MPGFHYSTALPQLVRSIACLSFPQRCLGSCWDREGVPTAIRGWGGFTTSACLSFSPLPPHAPWAKLFFTQGKYNLISIKHHRLPRPLSHSLSDGVFEGFPPRPWPNSALVSPSETSPCSLMALRCCWAAAGAGGSGVGGCHRGLWLLLGRKRVLGHFYKKFNTKRLLESFPAQPDPFLGKPWWG